MIVAVALSLLVALVAAESDVLTLTRETFQTTLEANPVLMVEFYAPWCGHCKNLAPKYEQAATQLNGIAKIAKVDCTSESSLCQDYEIRGYPTIKVFKDGTPSDYNMAREADAIVGFMRKAVLPPVTDVDASTYAGFVESDKVIVLGVFESKEDDEYKVFFETAAKLNDKYTFGASIESAVAKEVGISVPGVVVYKRFDDAKDVYDGAFEASALSTFIITSATPLMDDIGPENYRSYMESGIPLAYLFVGNDGHRADPGKYVEAIAKEFKGKVNFVYVDAIKYGTLATNLNLKSEWPAFAIQDDAKNTKFPFEEETLSEAAIRKFVSDFVEGKLTPSLKSEEIPEKQEGPVVVVVGKSYEQIVNDKSKDVLIEFYAPWCGHCKKLEPIYAELATSLQDNDNIVIAKMDATANDIPGNVPFRVQGFPTIKLIKAGENEVVDYTGDRSHEGFVKFLKANAAHGSNIGEVLEKSTGKDEL